MKKQAHLFYSFLLLNSIHWGFVVLTALLGHLVANFLLYEQLPWFRLPMVLIELVLLAWLLPKQAQKEMISFKTIILMTLMAATLFVAAQFDFYYDYQPFFCGNALIEGAYADDIDSRNQNLMYVRITETLLFAIGIILYGLKYRKVTTQENNSE